MLSSLSATWHEADSSTPDSSGYRTCSSQYPCKLDRMTPAGYLAKRISTKPDWLRASQVTDIYSLSGCVSEVHGLSRGSLLAMHCSPVGVVRVLRMKKCVSWGERLGCSTPSQSAAVG